MRVAAGFGLFLLFSGLPVTAQSYSAAGSETLGREPATTLCDTKVQPDGTKNGGNGATVTVCETTVVPACPIDMHVRQGVGGGMLAVGKDGRKAQVFAPRLRLFLHDLRGDQGGQKIARATVVVHGSDGRGRILPVHAGRTADSDSGQVEKTLTVSLAAWDEAGVSGDFRLPGFASTNRIDLQSVTYEDGSTWKLSGGEACRVAPDPLMRIGH